MKSVSGPAAAPLIRFINVKKAFGEKVVYTDLNLDVFAGETLAVLGMSGSGKSVMLKLLSGLLKPDAGQVLAVGQDLVGRVALGQFGRPLR